MLAVGVAVVSATATGWAFVLLVAALLVGLVGRAGTGRPRVLAGAGVAVVVALGVLAAVLAGTAALTTAATVVVAAAAGAMHR